MKFPRSLCLPGGMRLLLSTSVTLMSDGSQQCCSPGYGRSPDLDTVTVMGFPRTSSTPGEMCTVELDFPRASVPPGESCAEARGYIKLTWLAELPVCAWTVTGSLLFGSLVFVMVCLPYGVVAGSIMASGRSSEMDQAGPSSASSGPLPGTFLGLALDMRSDKLYDLVLDIPDAMGLRALRPSAAIVKVMSVPDSRCIRVVTPDDHANIAAS